MNTLHPPADYYGYRPDPGPEAIQIIPVNGTLSDSEKAVIRWLIVNPPSRKRPGHGIANKTHGISINDELNEATFEERNGLVFLATHSVRFTIRRAQPAQLARTKIPMPAGQLELFSA
jgi:hypothetical protein